MKTNANINGKGLNVNNINEINEIHTEIDTE